MKANLWWTWRQPATRIYILLSVVIGSFSLQSTAYTWEHAASLGLAASRTAVVFAAPFLVAALYATVTVGAAEESRFLGGADLEPQRIWQISAASLAVATGALVASVTAFLAVGLTQATADSAAFHDVVLTRALVRTGLTLVGMLAAMTAMAHGRDWVSALAVSFLLTIGHLYASFSLAYPGGQLLTLIWPTTAATIVSEVGRNHSMAEATASAVSLIVWLLLMLLRLSREPFREGSRRPSLRREPKNAVRRLNVLVLLVAFAFLPATITRLPEEVSPALAIQRASDGRFGDQAPDQATRQFFEAFRSGDLSKASGYVLERKRHTLPGTLPHRFAVASPGDDFELVDIEHLERAEVVARLTAGEVHVCLERERHRWRIFSVQASEHCRW